MPYQPRDVTVQVSYNWQLFRTKGEAERAAKMSAYKAMILKSEGRNVCDKLPGQIEKVHNGWKVCLV